MTIRPLSALLAGLLLAGTVHAADQASQVHADHPWIRVLPAGLPAGGYVTLSNRGNDAVTLKGADSPRYAHAMLHQSSTEGGMGRMKMVDKVAIPAHGEVTFAPGGYHIMLMQASKPVQAGEQVPVTLQFADGSQLTVEFLARPANAVDGGSPMPKDHMHGG